MTSSKTWENSQEYEMENAIVAMGKDYFKKYCKQLESGDLYISKGAIPNDLMFYEFFNNSKENWINFTKHINDKVCLDIGPCILSPLVSWDIASKRYLIEPLYKRVYEWQLNNLGKSVFEDLICYGHAAEIPIPELIGKVNGAILCRNILDHTPNWKSILSLISRYATKDCRFLLWTDLDHKGNADIGHYDITKDIEYFKNLIKNLGFKIVREYQDLHRDTINYGCFSIKE